MFLLISFFFIILIPSTVSICNSSNFHPCACCDPVVHHCVHNAGNLISYLSTCVIFQVFNRTCRLDTSTYCCVPKNLDEGKVMKNKVILFNKYCKKKSDSMVMTIISSCDSISRRCDNAKNSIAPVLPEPTSEMETLPVEEDEEEVTTKISTFIIDDDDDNRKPNLPKLQPVNRRKTEDDETISIWVPERKTPETSEEKTNRAIRQFQSRYFLSFFTICFVLFC